MGLLHFAAPSDQPSEDAPPSCLRPSQSLKRGDQPGGRAQRSTLLSGGSAGGGSSSSMAAAGAGGGRETDATAERSNAGLLQLQQSMMQQQDADLAQLERTVVGTKVMNMLFCFTTFTWKSRRLLLHALKNEWGAMKRGFKECLLGGQLGRLAPCLAGAVQRSWRLAVQVLENPRWRGRPLGSWLIERPGVMHASGLCLTPYARPQSVLGTPAGLAAVDMGRVG